MTQNGGRISMSITRKQEQWRMRFANHDTWLLATWLYPFAKTKKLEWEKVLNHYA